MLILLPLLLLFVFGCQKPQERSLFAMDTFMQLSAYGRHADKALNACEQEIRSLEAALSATLPNSDVSRINTADGMPTTVHAETAALLADACAISERVDGAFDITVRPLVTLWGFSEEEQRVPSQDEIDARLSLVDWRQIDVRENMVTVPRGMQIDLGGIAKGYCGERLRQLIKSHGVTGALLTLGGNIEAIGAKPDGSAWRVAIRDPQNEQQVLGVIEVIDRAVVTAGSYQRYFEQDGVRYHHILDPKTGYPADSGLCSVTVIAESGTLADALSTAFLVLGTEPALALLETERFADCEAVFVETDGTVTMSSGVCFVE